MASNAFPGPSSEDWEPRPQAGPLPRKRGEIGFQEGMDLERDADGSSSNSSDSSASPLPARHPADRAVSPAPSGTSRTSGPPNSPSAAAPDHPSTSADTSSMRKTSKHAVLLSWIDPRPSLNRIKLGGVALATILRLVIQLALIATTIVLWVLVAKKLSKDTSSAVNGVNGSDANSNSSSTPALGSSAAIFVHVVFSIVTLAQLLFLERCIFLIRAQRYMHAHPGASLPTHSRSGSSMGMAFAPWNRPPLPTYAATLAASGYGTGDVEDNIIAIPPPPAYGNTRGSTLLLAAFMRNSLRAASPQGSRPLSQASPRERPVSYRSHDEEWEERCDAERALHLAETLERLEEAASSSRTAVSGRGSH